MNFPNKMRVNNTPNALKNRPVFERNSEFGILPQSRPVFKRQSRPIPNPAMPISNHLSDFLVKHYCPKQYYDYTVETFLEAAGTSRKRGYCPTEPGYEADHVVELQLMVAAVNGLTTDVYRPDEEWQTELADFFQEPDNYQILPKQENREKGLAITRYINKEPMEADDKYWITMVRLKWIQMRLDLFGHDKFVQQMNGLLQTNWFGLGSEEIMEEIQMTLLNTHAGK